MGIAEHHHLVCLSELWHIYAHPIFIQREVASRCKGSLFWDVAPRAQLGQVTPKAMPELKICRRVVCILVTPNA